jgi:4-hydroxy-tetrahydrodipicolinate reductase
MGLRLAIHGAAGRMGKRLVALAGQDSNFEIVAAIEHAGHPDLGADAGRLAGIPELGIPLAVDWPQSTQVVIDFSIPEACRSAVEQCLARRLPLVVATTGLDAAHVRLIRDTATQIPICWAPSMSLAVNLTMRLAEQAARALRDQHPDIEIIERHHRFKEDAPSGTALKFGQLLAEAAGLTRHVHGREGQSGARTQQEIGYHAVRAGDDPGQHTIIFGMMGETIELRVAASNRDCYAQGALAAAKFLADRPAGLYDMFDVLGLTERD